MNPDQTRAHRADLLAELLERRWANRVCRLMELEHSSRAAEVQAERALALETLEHHA
jgi:hypothetical protein